MTINVLFDIIASMGLAVGGWAAMQILKVPTLEEKVDHLVERVDALYDHLIGRDADRP